MSESPPAKPVEVLVVEDNPGDAVLIREYLPREGPLAFTTKHAPRLATAVQMVAADHFDIVLLDLGLPDSVGVDTVRALRREAPNLPIVVLTGNDDEHIGVAAIREGAQDYVVKGQMSDVFLPRVLVYALERHQNSERLRKSEENARLGRDVLHLLNRPGGSTDTVRDVLQMIKAGSGIEAVGIRLQDGDDFPYYQTEGFPDHFVEAERLLCDRDTAGEVARDTNGSPVLACMCGNILTGRTDPALPFFTEGGSFWTNSTTDLLAATAAADPWSLARNRCNKEGYESVALVPLPSGKEIIGLLQLNDHRRDQFTKDMIVFFEGLGTSIGIALARKRAMEALRESEERLSLTLDAVNDGVWDWHVPSGQAVFSPHWYDMLDYAPYEFAQTYDCFRALVHPDDLERVDTEIQEHFATGDAYAIELRMLAKGGDWRWILTRGKVVETHQDGSPIRLVGTHSDISQRKAAEETLRERDEQLLQSQKMEAIGQLAGGIAHDFNNLLTAVIGYSELLLLGEEFATSPARKDLGEIKRAAERAAALTGQILAFSRRQALRPAVVSLNEVLKGMEPLLRRTLGEDVDLVSHQDPNLGHAEVDIHQFEQVLMNLALNARDAMASGGRLTLETGNAELDEEYCRTHPEVIPGSYVMLAVSDTGAGMDAATRERMFEPFFTTKETGKGTGLGLSTVYGIVRQSGGSVSVYSEPGKGTSFKIYLPRTMASRRVESPVTLGGPLKRGGETILVVEDEVAVRSLVARVLGELGYRVYEAGTGAEALQVLADIGCRLDLLLTDLVLSGGMQGKDVVRALQSSLPDLPALYMSGYTRNAIVHAGRLDEGVNFLEKPFTPEALANAVRRVLDKAHSSG
jgi:PAS domain S-box-containing protein